MKKRVYIAGPISKGDLHHNIKQATDAFMELLRAGYAPFCPHWSAFADGPVRETDGEISAYARTLPAGTTHDDWIGVDLPWVSVAHAVLRLPGESVGADAETDCAEQLGIPVYRSLEQLMTAI